ncbi:mechanosensitive ion channel family protein [Agromyces seonyuensis]|uniref:Mechanosensitive ion channel n=1 Tax=Agromyces seonyuensis TaxID=2662446 RepID=A0A6I4P2A5_9MICO|nr:mechanosensitive ion channel domain-containing protein [Agromyces seonyuensis]MWB97304.1 mechanosensitive ion channel [Agromyces seonyuensis]
MNETWQDWLFFGLALLALALVVFAISGLAALILRAIARKREWANRLIVRLRWPFRTLLVVIGLWVVISTRYPDYHARGAVDHTFLIVLIASTAWLLCQAILFATDLAIARYPIDVADNRRARRARTQLAVLRRLVVVVMVFLAAGVILFTFDEARALGASLLASAGIVSIVAGLAAQSTLANLFAGIQLAFSDAIRVDDVVVVEGEWGRIEEITLNYVVVGIWDERRLVLPCTYFTTKPFQNWTRTGSELLGSVELDLDWRVSARRMRDELDRILERTDLWDGRAKVLQVTDAVGGFVRVRVLVTAIDSPTLFDLRCFVREELVDWVQREHEAAEPAQHVLVEQRKAPSKRSAGENGAAATVPPAEPEEHRHDGLFSGSPEAEQRAAQFTQAIPIVRLEEEEAERADGSSPAGGPPSAE